MNSNEQFLREEYIPLLQQLSDNEVGLWGVLSPQGMIEHMTDAFANAYGRIRLPAQTPEAILPKVRAFALSETPFKENTKNILLPDEPLPVEKQVLEESIAELETEVNHFFETWSKNPQGIIRNPFFGDLDYEHWVGLLYKHAWHHLNQFGITQ